MDKNTNFYRAFPGNISFFTQKFLVLINKNKKMIYKQCCLYYKYELNKIRKATNRVKSAMDSQSANPKRAYPINCFAIKGLRPALWIKDPNTIPIPAPTPANAIRALPAPINFAACTMCIKKNEIPSSCSEWIRTIIPGA